MFFHRTNVDVFFSLSTTHFPSVFSTLYKRQAFKMKTNSISLVICFLIGAVLCLQCGGGSSEVQYQKEAVQAPKLDLQLAEKLIALPLKCIQQELPYKGHHVLADSSELVMPILHHPVFYGCFDWHSAVHAHWSLVYLMKQFPNIRAYDQAKKILDEHITKENIQIEIDYFTLNNYTKNFERTYGWAWVMVLTQELKEWSNPDGQRWYETIKPLTDVIAEKYQTYLPNLVYPIRVGEHSNTAFGLSFAYDLAKSDYPSLASLIESRALEFYANDVDCPLSWEPSGYDFLSPCLQELDLMRKVLPVSAFVEWHSRFIPHWQKNERNILTPAIVKNRNDGKLVHLDGLNFSRSWCLYPFARSISSTHLSELADEHLAFSITKITDGDYNGEHWLASFALYAFKMQDGE